MAKIKGSFNFQNATPGQLPTLLTRFSGAVMRQINGNLQAGVNYQTPPNTANNNISNSCGVFSTISSSPVPISGLSASIQGNGNPVMVMFIPDGTFNGLHQGNSRFTTSGIHTATITILRNSVPIAYFDVVVDNSNLALSPGMFNYYDYQAPVGRLTYTVYVSIIGGDTFSMTNTKLAVFQA